MKRQHGEARDVREVQLEELQALPPLEAADDERVLPDQQARGVERPRAALLVEVRQVLGRDLADRAHDRDVEPAPPRAAALEARLQVLDEVPLREAPDPLQAVEPPDEAASRRGRSRWRPGASA